MSIAPNSGFFIEEQNVLTGSSVGIVEVMTSAGTPGSAYPQVVVMTAGDELRPAGSTVVIWVGSPTPVNKALNDIWIS